MALLDREGKEIYFEHHAGGGVGRPIVLVHGWAGTSRTWDATLQRLLATKREVVTVDHRACGRSSKDFDDVSIEAIASDVVELVRRLKLDRPVLTGWSLGGAVVVASAAVLGEEVSGLVITSGATPRYTAVEDWPHGADKAAVESLLTSAASDRSSTFRALVDALCAKPISEAARGAIWMQLMESGVRAGESLASLITLDQRDVVGDLRVPVLLMHGTEDTLIPCDSSRAAVDMFPNARLVELLGSGHAPFIEDPEKFHDALLRFLDEICA